MSTRLPGPEVLLEAGRTDGQTKLVRRGTNVMCYSWSAASQTWNEIGDVMGANPPTEGKTMYQGTVGICYYMTSQKKKSYEVGKKREERKEIVLEVSYTSMYDLLFLTSTMTCKCIN